MELADAEASELGMLRDWCRWMGINPRKSVLILGIPEDCEDDQMQECLEGSLLQMGRFEVLGRMYREEDDAFAALVELNREVDYAVVPREIPGIGRPWSVVCLPRCSGEGFLGRLFHFLEQQGQTVESVAGALGLGLGKVCWLRSLSRAIQPWVETVRYQPLGVFSGRNPPSPGEEAFEPWVEHATDTLLVWEGVSEREKRRRLLESLRGAALEVASDILSEIPARSMEQCLAAMAHVFGDLESPAILRLKCMTAEQQPGERLSAFVFRLEVLLQKAIRANALDSITAEHLRTRQVLTGSHTIVDLQPNLRKLASAGSCPGFLQMVAIAQETERWEDKLAEEAAEDASAQEGAKAKAQAEGDKVEEEQREQEDSDNRAQAPAGLGQTGLAEAPGKPRPADMGGASWAGPRDPNSVLGRLIQALNQDAKEHYQEGLKPIPEESESEDGAGELSPSMASPGK